MQPCCDGPGVAAGYISPGSIADPIKASGLLIPPWSNYYAGRESRAVWMRKEE
ncbi:hypothetical protein K469DRAFT_719078 [Zopfia rhizophila CBS 207.26]|uniref:Uncharacterized protein n=1 Tax=Zopfia rhizophila CBS 207.26 TaxID=1314779 RepID=A0A6A6EK52_9PEZI|nr:hypothetical protein K469DRAFT_719078 [Zopfia rhizophila CBS 207.26]